MGRKGWGQGRRGGQDKGGIMKMQLLLPDFDIYLMVFHIKMS
jgi:hypothetical protein